MSDPTAVVNVAPLIEALQPYISAIAGSVVLALGGLVFAALKGAGIAVASAYQTQIETACANEAGKLVAGALGNLATAQVNVGSPGIAAAANAIVSASAPALARAVSATGLTPELAASIIVGQIGKLQATMTSAAPAAAK
jgi:hypothetical protein